MPSKEWMSPTAPPARRWSRPPLDQFGRLDLLVNNAGVDHLGLNDKGEPDAFAKVVETDFYGVYHMSRAAIAALRLPGTGSSHVVGLRARRRLERQLLLRGEGRGHDCTRALAMDEAAHGVGVNAVNPSLTYTALAEGMKDQAELIARFEGRISLGRGAQPDDIAGAIAFLVSEDARYITGVTSPSMAASPPRTPNPG